MKIKIKKATASFTKRTVSSIRKAAKNGSRIFNYCSLLLECKATSKLIDLSIQVLSIRLFFRNKILNGYIVRIRGIIENKRITKNEVLLGCPAIGLGIYKKQGVQVRRKHYQICFKSFKIFS